MAANKLLGKWREVERIGDFDAFFGAVGYTPEVREIYRKFKFLTEYQKEGDTWKSTLLLEGGPSGKTVSFRVDEPYMIAMPDGEPLRVVTEEDEKGFRETSTFTQGKQKGITVTTRRYVDDQDRMVVEHTCKGVNFTIISKRA